jgi:hypothetical protein
MDAAEEIFDVLLGRWGELARTATTRVGLGGIEPATEA